ncbi:MAG TPA: YhdP family protein, partial [Burkholderiales bacterium]|nr:YhdP family protein [Burkholderiales bacterium]
KFEVVAKVQGVTLDYAEGWPPVEDIAGEVAFRGSRMDIQASAGRIYGIAVGNTRASIPAIGGHDEHLVVHGDGQGPIADYLRFIARSPVRDHIGGFTDDMRGTGNAKLRLDIDLPLRKPELAKVSGAVQLDATEFIVDPRVPPLTAASAKMEFSERGVEVREGRAAIYGQPLSVDGGTRKDGTIAFVLGGRIDVERLVRQFDTMPLAQLSGAADWKGTLTLKNKSARLRLDSGLNGIESRLPAPLAKEEAATLPLKVDLRDSPGAPARLFVSLQEVVSAALMLDGTAVRRGEIAFSHDAQIPDRDGLQVTGSLATLDVDAWRGLLGGGDGAGRLSAVALSVGALDISGRRFHQLRIEGERDEEGWHLALSGREVNGTVSWLSEDGGRLGAHFASLVIPAPSSQLDTTLTAARDRERPPGVDLVADSFEFEGKKLGRLQLNAVPEQNSWRLDRLALESPDGSMDVKGSWSITDMPRTALDVRIQATDIGKLLTRLGYAEGVKGGSGSLAGQVSWIGSPSRLDLPSLAGQLKLDAKNGRFAKLDPGAAKLLGILSLQALPKRLTLDFRDIFSSGFSFDSITADVTVTGGVAHTEDFRMNGSAAQVRMKGSVDLAAETQDLNVRVLPQLSTGVAIAGAVVNPAVGLAALLAQKALGDPFEKLAALEYRVTGTWNDPKVERVSRSEDQSPKGRK